MKTNKINKDWFQEFFNKIQDTNIELSDLIDVDKILKNIEQFEINLNMLNYLICFDQDLLEEKIRILYKKDPIVFEILPLLVATEPNKKILFKNNIMEIKDIINSVDNVISFINDTKLNKLIISGKITNFIDYLIGVNIGKDTHTRKNRIGTKNEKEIDELLKKAFSKNDNIIYKTQQKVPEIDKNKKFDFLILNKNNGHCVVIETSFYNSIGSKIDTTRDEYIKINENVEKINKDKNYYYKFIWIPNGEGLKSQKLTWKNKIDSLNFIYRKEEVIEVIKNYLY